MTTLLVIFGYLFIGLLISVFFATLDPQGGESTSADDMAVGILAWLPILFLLVVVGVAMVLFYIGRWIAKGLSMSMVWTFRRVGIKVHESNMFRDVEKGSLWIQHETDAVSETIVTVIEGIPSHHARTIDLIFKNPKKIDYDVVYMESGCGRTCTMRVDVFFMTFEEMGGAE